jgi:hypothetical protein
MNRQRLVSKYTSKCFLFLIGRWCVSARPVVIGIVKAKKGAYSSFHTLSSRNLQ